MNDKSPTAVKCANEHVYYGVACGPCPLCGWNDYLTPADLKRFGPINRVLTPEELVAIERGARQASFLSDTLARACFVEGDSGYLKNLAVVAAGFMDKIERIQERIMTESRK